MISEISVDMFIAIAAVSVLSAILIIFGAGWWSTSPYRARSARLRAADEKAVILFDGDTLVDASPAAQSLLRHYMSDGSDRAAIVAILARRFPDLPRHLARMQDDTLRMLAHDDSRGELDVTTWDGMLRLTLIEPTRSADAPHVHPLTIAAIEEELDTLRSLGENAPLLIWKQDDDGAVTWANRAYLMLSEVMTPAAETTETQWPLPRIFEDVGPAGAGMSPVVRRFGLDMPDREGRQWFEVTSLRRGTSSMHFGVDANRLVEAEQAQKNFVQTLTKTFAHLSIGLAIFDRKRRLVLFNPALLDLTGLPIAFLSSRPQVHTVLDRLRDMNMLPEPKNYTTWRDQVAALEAAAETGTYCETWNLSGGQTYRVSGRPHPDGAIAFLFEDISHEVSLTRHFRGQIETAQAVLDTVDEAVAVFSSAGTLTMSNLAYDGLWRSSDAEGLGEATLTTELRQWQARCAPTTAWADLRTYLGNYGDRAPWSVSARLEDGRSLGCRFVPLPGGATLIGFRPGAMRCDPAQAAEDALADRPLQDPAPRRPAIRARA
jgi:PAS domain-containing protein